MKKNRYWRNGVFAVLAFGIAVTVVSVYRNMWSGGGFWEHSGYFGMAVSGVGVLGWLCLTVPQVGADMARVWKASKTTALVTLALFATGVIKLYRFTGPHFYGWDHPEAWAFLALALLLVAYLLLKASLALIDALEK